MRDLQELIKLLKQSNLAKVSRETGIHYNTVYLISTGVIRNPKFDKLKKLDEYFNKGE